MPILKNLIEALLLNDFETPFRIRAHHLGSSDLEKEKTYRTYATVLNLCCCFSESSNSYKRSQHSHPSATDVSTKRKRKNDEIACFTFSVVSFRDGTIK
ncbi:hypothetical protein AVEN_226591-1 [Araneus ventricosus]|uniref:Uncharacterized protein n=1 Tax=Araneus ventricosus TaxID=182803 RepID=A0A4Y2JPN9_ARAVE|nr:hypothetical protein AVEN_226591-1 [Araneus ventricosus]